MVHLLILIAPVHSTCSSRSPFSVRPFQVPPPLPSPCRGLTEYVDGHNDFAYMVRGWFRNNLNQPDFDIHTMPIGQTDLGRLQRGMLGGQIWSAFVPW
jgi:hypothetical protein